MKNSLLKRILSAAVCGAMLLSLTACGQGGDTSANAARATGGNIGDVALSEGDTYAVISIKDYGDITVKLFPDIAPTAVSKFTEYASSGYYDGKNFHRIIQDFMIQGGSETGTGAAGTIENSNRYGIEISESARHFYGALCCASAAGQNGTQFYIVNNKTPQDITKLDTATIRDYADQSKATAESLKGVEGSENYYKYYSWYYTYYTNLYDMLTKATEAIKTKYLTVGGVPSLDGGYTVFGQTVEGFDVIDKITAVETEVGTDGADSKPVNEIIIDTIKVMTYGASTEAATDTAAETTAA